MKELMAVGPFNESFMVTQEHIQGIMLRGERLHSLFHLGNNSEFCNL
jgi:hypothetical protein